MDSNQDTRLDILLDELSRTREAVADGNAGRTRFMNSSLLLLLVLLLLGWTAWFPMAALALPFVAIYLVLHYALITHCLLYARAHAAGLEERVNREVGETLLVRESVAARSFGPLGRRHFFGFAPENVASMFSVTTLHYLIVCVVFFLAGCMRANYIIRTPELSPVARFGEVYFPVLFLWLLINAAYIVYYYYFSDHEQNLVAAVQKEYEKKTE